MPDLSFPLWPYSSGSSVALLSEVAALARIRTVVLGDSLVSQGFFTNASNNLWVSRAWYTWLAALTNQKIQIIGAVGTTGNTTAQILARFDADVAPFAPDMVLLEGGWNDGNTSIASATTVANIEAIHAKCRAIGALCMYVGTSSKYFASATKTALMVATDSALMIYAQANSDFLFVPMSTGIADYSTAAKANGGEILAACMQAGDNPHITGSGGYLSGGSLYLALSQAFKNPPAGDGPQPYNQNVSPNSYVGLINAMQCGTAGTKGALVTGNVADSWGGTVTGTMAAVGAIVARTDGGAGNWQQYTCTLSTAYSDYVQHRQTTAETPNGPLVGLVGKTVVAEVDVDIACAAGISEIYLACVFKTGAAATMTNLFGGNALGTSAENLSAGALQTAFVGRIATKPFLVAAGMDDVDFYVRASCLSGGTMVVKIGAPALAVAQ